MAQNLHEIKAIAARYVTALFGLAQAKNKHQQVANDLQRLVAATQSQDEWQRMVQNPMIPAAEKAASFAAILTALKADATTIEQVTFIANQGRSDILTSFAALYQDAVLEALGQLQADIVSAQPLSPAQEKQISESLSAAAEKPVLLKCRIDASIIGGLIITMGSRMLDRSVAGKLNRLRVSLNA